MTLGFNDRLLNWFDRHGRKNLPWQQAISPYRVWVSEIMLQQTQVTTVIPYFEKFTHHFPTINTLAEATLDEVLHLWTGLGYYARARNLHKTAGLVSEKYQGEFPDSLDDLMKLPGIGRSTAGAILAIAFNQPATILDGNVKRTLSRYFGIEGWPGNASVANQLWDKAERLTPDTRTADYTQAMMDLGATLCTRTNPACHSCPFHGDCHAHQHDQTDHYPGKKPKKTLPEKSTCMLILENQTGELLLEKRPDQGLWGGLWGFPECRMDEIADVISRLGLEPHESELLESFRHTFTHFHLDITPVLVKLNHADKVNDSNQQLWYSRDHPIEIGLTHPVTKLIKQLEPSLQPGFKE
jgi:A/G-specific adenine glycosylase